MKKTLEKNRNSPTLDVVWPCDIHSVSLHSRERFACCLRFSGIALKLKRRRRRVVKTFNFCWGWKTFGYCIAWRMIHRRTRKHSETIVWMIMKIHIRFSLSRRLVDPLALRPSALHVCCYMWIFFSPPKVLLSLTRTLQTVGLRRMVVYVGKVFSSLLYRQ